MQTARRRISQLVAAIVLFATLSSSPGYAQKDHTWPPPYPDPPVLVFTDPILKFGPEVLSIKQAYLPLWIEALESDETDLRREAAVAIAIAHRQQLLDCSDAVDPLMELLARETLHPVLRADVARALVNLDARKSASLLMKQLKVLPTIARIVEPALANWDFKPMRDVWLKRLETGSSASRSQRQLAIQSLGTVREVRAAEAIGRLVQSRQYPAARLAAARALASIQRNRLESTAEELFRRTGAAGTIDRMAAARLLTHHESEQSRELMIRMAQDPEDGVAGIAWATMLKLAPLRLIPLAAETLKRNDGKLRKLTVQTLSHDPNARSIKLLGSVLGDPHPDVRASARLTLQNFAEQHELRAEVVAQADESLEASNWRALEQAARLVGDLDHEPASLRLFELLTDDHPEVASTAAWALRTIDSDENLSLILQFLLEVDAALDAKPNLALSTQLVLSHLFEALGQAEFQPATELALKWVPKETDGPRYPLVVARASAVWTAGKLKAGSKDEALATELYERIADQSMLFAEHAEVKYASAIATGMIGSDVRLKELRGRVQPPLAGFGNISIAWAVSRLSGEPMMAIQKLVISPQNWFLQPIGSRLESETAAAGPEDQTARTADP